MNAVAGRIFSGVDGDALPARDTFATSGLQCFHCGQPVPTGIDASTQVDGQQQSFCCIGCVSVAKAILDAGLVDFYRHRVGYSAPPPPDVIAEILPINGEAITSDSTKATESLHLYLSGLHCAACVWLAERTLNRISGIASARVNLTTGSAQLRIDPRRAPLAAIVSALRRVGLDAEQADSEAHLLARRTERRRALLELGVALLCMMQVMMLVVPLYLADPGDIANDARQLMAWTAWLITLPVLLFSARPIFRSAWRAISVGFVGMDVPVALALLITFAASTVALITHHGQHYFDAITMFVALLLAARWIESGIRSRTAESIARLSNARPLRCQRLADYPRSEYGEAIDARRLVIGDHVLIAPGETVPADAIVVRGSSEIDEALMTGESVPVMRREGDVLVGGTINTLSPLVARITAVGRQTLLAQLGQLVESSLLYRPPFHGLAEQMARWLAPGTLVAAVIAALIWWQLDASRSAEIAIAVLVVTCPCAFALAAPAAQAAALSRLTRAGLLVTRGHLVETLASATDVVFDKTGTLTTGEMTVSHVDCAPEFLPRALALAVALERGAVHPAARALNQFAAQHLGAMDTVPVAESLFHIAGGGVEGRIDGVVYRLGAPVFADASFSSTAINSAAQETNTETCVVLVDQNASTQRACFYLRDPVREDAALTIASLRNAGLRVHLLSGDAAPTVRAVASQLSINPAYVRAAQTATQKQAYIAALSASGCRVIAVGDGVNDAPMLAGAHGSIGLASGSTLTRLSADAVLAADKGRLLSALTLAFATARRAQQVIRQNLWWALAYNAGAIPLAIAGMVTPLIAAAGMAISSLIVVVNASRLLGAK